MKLIGLTVPDLMGHMPTDHGLAHALPDTGTGYTLATPEALGIHVADAPIFTSPEILAAYVRGFIDHQVLTDDKEN
ncbi:hypothetical protein [Corynebacterium provencense]|uniref:Uncharacterized protein n=1 Tax=Corynebacterium provencense TaxID=1737425 RepID=A0A2Z3YQS6_9CORY|nr:hypothetical protein [Corynebacterium provencense]AWT27312.1 hypothetical protein Csp1_25640 [Corynebacterium provencense]